MEIVKALGWPHFTFLFCVVFILLFRKPLFALISRITSIDKSGIKASQSPEVPKRRTKERGCSAAPTCHWWLNCSSRYWRTHKGWFNAKRVRNGWRHAKVLIKHLAGTRLLLEFEQVHNLIFGSQIALLKKLNEVAGQGKSSDFITAHFEYIRGLYPTSFDGCSLDQYLGFLLGRSLITTKGNVYHITNLGVEYLTWMTRNGKGEDKPL